MRLRGWMARTAVVAALAAAGLAGLGAPAFAADAQLSEVGLAPTTIGPGQETTVTFTVKMTDGKPGTTEVSVTSSNPKVTCSANCNFNLPRIVPVSGTKFSVRFRATGIFLASEQAIITVRAGNDSRPLPLAIHVGAVASTGPPPTSAPPSAAAPTVPQVSGTVVDEYTNAPIESAAVSIRDSANPAHTYSFGTDKSGAFSFSSSAAQPIAPGAILFTVDKSGIGPFSVTKNAVAGVPLTGVRLAVQPLASADATGGDVVPPIGGVDSGNPAGVATDSPVDQAATGSARGGGTSWIFLAAGVLLMLLGIGAIALLFVRGRGGNDEDDDGRDRPGPGPRRAPVPVGADPWAAGAGGPLPTRVARPAIRDNPTLRLPAPVAPEPGNNDQTVISPAVPNLPTQELGLATAATPAPPAPIPPAQTPPAPTPPAPPAPPAPAAATPPTPDATATTPDGTPPTP